MIQSQAIGREGLIERSRHTILGSPNGPRICRLHMSLVCAELFAIANRVLSVDFTRLWAEKILSTSIEQNGITDSIIMRIKILRNLPAKSGLESKSVRPAQRLAIAACVSAAYPAAQLFCCCWYLRDPVVNN